MNFNYKQSSRDIPRSGLKFVAVPKIDEEGGFMFGGGGGAEQQGNNNKGMIPDSAYWPSISSFFNRNMDVAQPFVNQSKLNNKGIYYPALPLNLSTEMVQREQESDMFSEIASALNPPPLSLSGGSLEARERVFNSSTTPATTLQSSVIARLLQQSESVPDVKTSKYPKTNTSNSSVSQFVGIEWTTVIAISYSLVLIVLTGLVATLFAQHSSTVGSTLSTVLKRKSISLVAEGWILTSGDCDFWYNGECLPKADGGIPDQRTLGGVIEEREIKATGLFSSVNVPFLCLSSSVISTAFSICVIPNQDERAHKTIKMFSMVLVVVFGTLFLFIQGAWSLPMNNILLVEFSFMVALFILMTYSTHKGSYIDVARLFDMMLTNPLIAVSVLSASGDDNTNRLVLVYSCMVLGHLALLVNYIESVQCDAVCPGLSGVCRRVYWICMIPFIVQYSFRFHFLATNVTVSQPTWSVAALSFTFAAFVIRAIVISLQSWYQSMEAEGVVSMDYVNVGAHSVKDNAESSLSSSLIHSLGMVRWALLELTVKVVIYLLVIIGFFIELNSN